MSGRNVLVLGLLVLSCGRATDNTWRLADGYRWPALGGPNALFLNDGTGHFTEQGADAGLTSSAGSTTIALADVDGDGWLDLYIANYKAYTTLDRMSPQERSFDHVVRQLGPGRFAVREQYRRDYRH